MADSSFQKCLREQEPRGVGNTWDCDNQAEDVSSSELGSVPSEQSCCGTAVAGWRMELAVPLLSE